jgi:hypothetical protein
MPLLLTDSTSAIYGQSCPVLNSYSSLKILPQSMTIKPWFAGMGSNHELDRILRSRNLLILKNLEVVKASKAGISYKTGTNFFGGSGVDYGPSTRQPIFRGVGRIEHTPLHCSHLFIRPPRTWTIPSTAPIGVAPPKRGCRFA